MRLRLKERALAAAVLFRGVLGGREGAAQDSLRLELKDVEVGEHWIYGDWEAARSRAARQKKPIFALFR